MEIKPMAIVLTMLAGWINRWDRMQERYIAKRSERFEIMVQLVCETQNSIRYILDLGCGTGSLMLEMLKTFPDSKVFGIDFDPTLLPLARKRLGSFGNRLHIILDDLRKPNWLEQIPESIDAGMLPKNCNNFHRKQF